MNFDPKYTVVTGKDGTSSFTVEHTKARVSAKSRVKKLRGQTVEIQGHTSDGRRLCVADGVSAWLPVKDLEPTQ